jgi:hypothetical protein
VLLFSECNLLLSAHIPIKNAPFYRGILQIILLFIICDHHLLVCFHYSALVQMAAATLSTASALVAVKAVLVALQVAVQVQMVVC